MNKRLREGDFVRCNSRTRQVYKMQVVDGVECAVLVTTAGSIVVPVSVITYKDGRWEYKRGGSQ